MGDMTTISVMVGDSSDYEFRYQGYYVPGKGDAIYHRGRKFKVKRIEFYTSDPDIADIYVKEIAA